MLNIESLAAYIEPKIWDAWPNPWQAELYSASGPIKLRFKLKKLNKNCYSYRIYDEKNNCLLSGASIYGVAAYIAPAVLRAFKEKETMEALLLLLMIANRRTS